MFHIKWAISLSKPSSRQSIKSLLKVSPTLPILALGQTDPVVGSKISVPATQYYSFLFTENLLNIPFLNQLFTISASTLNKVFIFNSWSFVFRLGFKNRPNPTVGGSGTDAQQTPWCLYVIIENKTYLSFNMFKSKPNIQLPRWSPILKLLIWYPLGTNPIKHSVWFGHKYIWRNQAYPKDWYGFRAVSL